MLVFIQQLHAFGTMHLMVAGQSSGKIKPCIASQQFSACPSSIYLGKTFTVSEHWCPLLTIINSQLHIVCFWYLCNSCLASLLVQSDLLQPDSSKMFRLFALNEYSYTNNCCFALIYLLHIWIMQRLTSFMHLHRHRVLRSIPWFACNYAGFLYWLLHERSRTAMPKWQAC